MSKESNTLEKISGIELVTPESDEAESGVEITDKEKKYREKEKRRFDRRFRRYSRKLEREREIREREEEKQKKADQEQWMKNALPELIKWNQEFIKNYAPGTANANKIAPLIGFFPSNIFQEMKDKSPEEKYQWFYENDFKNRMTLNIPRQTGRLDLTWEPSIRDEHNASGAFKGGDNFPGTWSMLLDPNYWFTATSTERKKLLFHELEHAVSATIGSHQTFNIVREKGEGRYDPWQNYSGASASNLTEQVDHYDEVFGLINIPKWLYKLINKTSSEVPISSWIPTNWAWANRREEQRAVLKTFLSNHGGVMTPKLLDGLCKERDRAGEFDWENSSLVQKETFIKTFKDNGFRLDILLYLNCTDKDKVLNHINSIVNADDRLVSRRVMTASVDNELTILYKALNNQGFEKQAEEVKLLVKSATHNR